MTPGARVQAAITCLDAMAGGMAAEQALIRWARGARYAGSGDRRAVRDHVYDVLRQKRLCAALGGGESGRALMLGLIRAGGDDAASLFSGGPYCPAPLSGGEAALGVDPSEADMWNLPDWLMPVFKASLGAEAEAQARALGARAPVFLRVNTARTDRAAAIDRLAVDGVVARPHVDVGTALCVTDGAETVRRSAAFAEGLVELQDASSQDIVLSLPQIDGPILDFCAGGGGKTLALAARYRRRIAAWDAHPQRMAGLPERAVRAGAEIRCLDAAPGGQALILADAPCSGSGSWRRDPEGKWLLSQEKLDALNAVQDSILDAAADRLAPGGLLAYATCSVLESENEARIAAFLARHPGWRVALMRRWPISPMGDGFFTAHLTRE